MTIIEVIHRLRLKKFLILLGLIIVAVVLINLAYIQLGTYLIKQDCRYYAAERMAYARGRFEVKFPDLIYLFDEPGYKEEVEKVKAEFFDTCVSAGGRAGVPNADSNQEIPLYKESIN